MQPLLSGQTLHHDGPPAAESPPPPARPVTQAIDGALDQLAALSALLDLEPDYAVVPLDVALPPDFLLSVVIPVYNEESTLTTILARVSHVPVPKEIIVVNDCSTDGTRAILEMHAPIAGLRVFHKPRNEGKGAALRTGFAAARGDVIIVQDADLEYDPRDFPHLLRPILAGDADVVYGSRFLGATPQDPSWLHRGGNALLTRLSNFFTGLSLTDMETCYKAFRREALEGIVIEQDRFGFEPEVTAKLARRGARILEVPISYQARGYADGKKIGIRDALNALYCIARYSGSTWRTSTRLPLISTMRTRRPRSM